MQRSVIIIPPGQSESETFAWLWGNLKVNQGLNQIGMFIKYSVSDW